MSSGVAMLKLKKGIFVMIPKNLPAKYNCIFTYIKQVMY